MKFEVFKLHLLLRYTTVESLPGFAQCAFDFGYGHLLSSHQGNLTDPTENKTYFFYLFIFFCAVSVN